MSIDNLYYSYTVTRRLRCNCSAYRFPHSIPSLNCSSSLPDDLDSIPAKVSHTTLKRFSDLLKNKFF